MKSVCSYLDVALLGQNLLGLLAEDLDLVFRELLALHELLNPALQLNHPLLLVRSGHDALRAPLQRQVCGATPTSPLSQYILDHNSSTGILLRKPSYASITTVMFLIRSQDGEGEGDGDLDLAELGEGVLDRYLTGERDVDRDGDLENWTGEGAVGAVLLEEVWDTLDEVVESLEPDLDLSLIFLLDAGPDFFLLDAGPDFFLTSVVVADVGPGFLIPPSFLEAGPARCFFCSFSFTFSFSSTFSS